MQKPNLQSLHDEEMKQWEGRRLDKAEVLWKCICIHTWWQRGGAERGN